MMLNRVHHHHAAGGLGIINSPMQQNSLTSTTGVTGESCHLLKLHIMCIPHCDTFFYKLELAPGIWLTNAVNTRTMHAHTRPVRPFGIKRLKIEDLPVLEFILSCRGRRAKAGMGLIRQTNLQSSYSLPDYTVWYLNYTLYILISV